MQRVTRPEAPGTSKRVMSGKIDIEKANTEGCRLTLFRIPRGGKNYTIEDFIRIAGEDGVEFIRVSSIGTVSESLAESWMTIER